MYTLLDVKIDVDFTPYLIYDGNQAIKLGKNKLSDYVVKKKQKEIIEITKRILEIYFIVKKLKFESNLIKTTLVVKPKEIKRFYSGPSTPVKSKNETFSSKHIEDIIKGFLIYNFGESKHLIGNGAPDGWMSWNIVLLKSGEFNDNLYEFGISTKKIKVIFSSSKKNQKKKDRPSPSESATLFKVGTVKKGNDGNQWVVKKAGTSVRWVRK